MAWALLYNAVTIADITKQFQQHVMSRASEDIFDDHVKLYIAFAHYS